MSLSRRTFVSALAAMLAGCGERAGSSSKGARVVSLSPSTTEAVFALGAGELLVGRSRFCDFPPEAARAAVVGGFADPNVEAVLALAPTLVVGAHGPAGPGLAEKLRAHGIDTYFPETESFEQIGAMIAGLGAKLGLGEKAREVVAGLAQKKNAVAAAVKGLGARRVVMLFDTGPIVAAGPGGFPDEMLRLAGATNLIVEGGAYPTIGLERLLALDPEILLDGASAGGEGTSPLLAKKDAPGWKNLKAFATGSVHMLGSAALRPGPRIGDGLVELARAIHGAALKLE